MTTTGTLTSVRGQLLPGQPLLLCSRAACTALMRHSAFCTLHAGRVHISGQEALQARPLRQHARKSHSNARSYHPAFVTGVQVGKADHGRVLAGRALMSCNLCGADELAVCVMQRTTGPVPTWWTASCATRRRTWLSR